MPSRSVVVLGGDGASLAVAGRLALNGHKVVLWEAPSAQRPVMVPCERPSLSLSGAGGETVATLAAVTSDLFEALAAGDVLITCAPPHAHSALADLVLPLVEPRHTLVMLLGRLGSLAHAKWLRDRGRIDLPTLAESDTAPFVGHRLAPDRVDISVVVANPGFGVFPACRTDAAMDVLGDLFPGAHAHAHVVAAALAAVESFLRAPALLMNEGPVERQHAASSLFEDGFTPAVARVAGVLDAERLALAVALGLDLPTAAEALHVWGLSPRGDLWAAVNGSYVLTHGFDQEAPQSDRLADDVAFGLRPWVELAVQLDVAVPLMGSLVTLFAAATATDGRDSGRSLEDLGIAGLTVAALDHFLLTGSGELGE